jgi:hypothetical protein
MPDDAKHKSNDQPVSAGQDEKLTRWSQMFAARTSASLMRSYARQLQKLARRSNRQPPIQQSTDLI